MLKGEIMSRKMHIEMNKNTTQVVGKLREDIKELFNLPKEMSEIVIYPGAIKHIKRKHPHAFKLYFHKIPQIIAEPDYVGMSEHHTMRIEYIKYLKEPILLALKYDGYKNLFVSSMYIIEASRVEKRIETQRIVPIVQGEHYKTQKQKYKNQNRNKR